MAELRLSAPEPIELVSPEHASTLIAATHLELEALEHRARDARQTADAAEARVRTEGADERSSTWAIVRLQRFIDGLRDEAERDAQTIIEASRRGARYPDEDEPPAPPAPRAAPPTPDSVVLRPVYAPPDPAPEAIPVLAPEPSVVPVPEAPPAAAEAVVAVAPQPAPDVVVPITTAAEPPGVEVPWEAEPLTREPLWAPVPAVADPEPNGSATPIEPLPAPTASELWHDDVVAPMPVDTAPQPDTATQPDAPARKRFLRGFPLSAVLEVIAVLLVLLFILLRLS